MNDRIREYIVKHQDKIHGRVLEVGSRDFNGNVSDLITESVKTDMEAGPNVDIVCPAEKLVEKFGEESFDTVVSLDAFEHMEDWRECLKGMWGVLKKDGWLVMTMASYKKRFHAYPNDYWRASRVDIEKIFPSLTGYEPLEGISIGWTVKKEGHLPDLSKIELGRPKR